MRKDLLLGVALLAAPIIAIAQTAPTPPDEPAGNSQWDNAAEPANMTQEPTDNGAADKDAQDPPPEPEVPQA